MEKWGMSLARRVIPKLAPISREERDSLVQLMEQQAIEFESKMEEKDSQIKALKSLSKTSSEVDSMEKEEAEFGAENIDEARRGSSSLSGVGGKLPSKSPALTAITTEPQPAFGNAKPEIDPSFFATTKGRHLLRETICNELKLSRDNSILDKQVETATAIIERLLLSNSAPFKPVAIKGTYKGSSISFDINTVSAMVVILGNHGLLKYLEEGYLLSDKALNLLLEAYEGDRESTELDR
jgi:hypothetical protein